MKRAILALAVLSLLGMGVAGCTGDDNHPTFEVANLYVTNPHDGTIRCYSLDPATGAITFTNAFPAQGVDPEDLKIVNFGLANTFVYNTNEGNRGSVGGNGWSPDGTLNPLTGTPPTPGNPNPGTPPTPQFFPMGPLDNGANGDGRNIAFGPGGRTVYVSSGIGTAAGNGFIFSFTVDASNGSWTPIASTAAAPNPMTHGNLPNDFLNGPSDMVVNANGTILYVANEINNTQPSGSITSLFINAAGSLNIAGATNVLMPVDPGPTPDFPESLALDNASGCLYEVGDSNFIHRIHLNANGTLPAAIAVNSTVGDTSFGEHLALLPATGNPVAGFGGPWLMFVGNNDVNAVVGGNVTNAFTSIPTSGNAACTINSAVGSQPIGGITSFPENFTFKPSQTPGILFAYVTAKGVDIPLSPGGLACTNATCQSAVFPFTFNQATGIITPISPQVSGGGTNRNCATIEGNNQGDVTQQDQGCGAETPATVQNFTAVP